MGVVRDGNVVGTRGSGIVFGSAGVLGMRRVGGVCEMCICLTRGAVRGKG